MNDYKELVEILRSCSTDMLSYKIDGAFAYAVTAAADAIEQLSAKCRQLEKRRDAIYADLKTMCTTVSSVCDFCKNNGENTCEKCYGTDWFDLWEWRGVGGEG